MQAIDTRVLPLWHSFDNEEVNLILFERRERISQFFLDSMRKLKNHVIHLTVPSIETFQTRDSDK